MNIPFFPNTKDNTHCVQACLKSVLKYYFPTRNYSFKMLDRMTAHEPGKWTWNSAPVVAMANLNFEVVLIEDFSYRTFAKLGERHLRKIWPPAMFKSQKKHSDLRQEQALAGQLMQDQRVTIKERPATVRDLRQLTSRSYVVMSFINPHILVGGEDYGSHVVLITKLGKESVTFHDPGLPAMSNKKVPLKLFLKAMRYPYKESASVMAFRYDS